MEHKCSKGSIEMRVGHNQWLQQPWDISQTRSRTMGRCEHRSNVLKRAPTIRNTCSRVLEHVFRGVQGNACKAKQMVVGGEATPHDTITMHRVSRHFRLSEKNDSAVARLSH